MAKRNEKIVIPVGATGFTREYIYQLEKENWEDGMDIFEKLRDNSQSVESLVDNIMDAIKSKKKIQEEELKMGLINNVFTGKEKTVVKRDKIDRYGGIYHHNWQFVKRGITEENGYSRQADIRYYFCVFRRNCGTYKAKKC